MGFGSDVGDRSTPWIVGGLAAVTNTLVLLAKRVPEQRRAPAATIVWMMMIFGLAFTAVMAGKLLDPYSPARLIAVMAGVCSLAFAIAVLALWLPEGRRAGVEVEAEPVRTQFRQALAQVWAETDARRFAIFIFIFVSMLAFSAQDLIQEPFVGSVFAWTPGQTTQMSGLQHAGVLAGMILVAVAGSGFLGRRIGSLRGWAVGGCVASAVALCGLVAAGNVGPGWPLSLNVFLLGAANGAFSIAAIGSMMSLANEGRARHDGVRIGLWGAAPVIAFGMGGILGAGASDVARWLLGSPAAAYAGVFALEALLFVVSAWLAARIRFAMSFSPTSPTSSKPGHAWVQPRSAP